MKIYNHITDAHWAKLRTMCWGILYTLILSIIIPLSIFAQQSTTGPTPPPNIDRGLHGPSRSQIVIPEVPSYIWHHGCGPTAVGMVIGYWDGHGCPNLISGSATTQTSAVNTAIADDSNDPSCGNIHSDHFHDYSCPIDSFPNLLQDKSETGGAHTSNCIADFMQTSWSSRNNYYGGSWFDDIPISFINYVNHVFPAYEPVAVNHRFNNFSWDEYKAEIDASRPVVLLVDTDGDNITDHFVTGIGYDDNTNEYGIYDTWDHALHWYQWREINNGNTWGIYGITTFHVKPTKKWTVLVFINGDNDLESDAIDDVNEMETIGSTIDVNIIVQIDQFDGTSNPNENWSETRRYYITQDNDQNDITSIWLDENNPIGEINMGDPNELINFVEWGIDNYPADRYAVIVWDHGSGWYKSKDGPITKGISDDYTDDHSNISIADGEWEDAISSIYNYLGEKLDLIGLDACLMQMLEVEDINKEYANYMVGSEQVEGHQGWAYNHFLDDLIEDPLMDASTLGQHIVNSAIDNSLLATQSLVDLSQIDELSSNIDVLAAELSKAYFLGFNNTIEAIRNNTQQFAITSHIDLYDFAERVHANATLPTDLRNAAGAVQSAVTNSVVLSRHDNSGNYNGANGIAIYYPIPIGIYNTSYNNLPISNITLWDDYISGSSRELDFFVKQGLDWLIANQHPDGPNRGYWTAFNAPSVGATGLAVLALTKGDYTFSDPVIQKAMNYIVYHHHGENGPFYVRNNGQTYETSMALMAMRAVNGPDQANGLYDNYIQWAENYLLNGRNSDGGWRYWANYGYSDLSVTQWPSLALYEGGFSDQTIWDAISSFATYQQKSSGEFYYSRNHYGQAGGSMTSAGLWCLQFNKNIGFNDQRVQQGFQWLVRDHWNLNQVPGYCHGGAYGYFYYYLYSLAKACQLSGQDIIFGHNWFDEISNRIVELQEDDGHWNRYMGQSVYGDFPTIMALLTLQLHEIKNAKIVFALHSHADLHIVGPNGNETGLNYEYDPPILQENIPNSTFEYIGPDSVQVVTIDPIEGAGAYGYYLVGTSDGSWELNIDLYQNNELVQSDTTTGNIEEGVSLGCNVIIEAPGSNVIMVPCEPEQLPCLATSPDSVSFANMPGDTVYGQFTIFEGCGYRDIETVNIIPHELKNDSGWVIPSTAITVSPTNFDVIPANESVLVTYSIIIPEGINYGSYSGTIGIQTANALNKGIKFDLTLGVGDITVLVTDSLTGLNGVSIDIYNATGELVESGYTSQSGYFYHPNLRAGMYIISIVPPLGYICPQTDYIHQLIPSHEDTVQFNLARMDITPQQRSSAYWKHVVTGAQYNKGSNTIPQYKLSYMADEIYLHFQNNRMSPIPIFGDEYPSTSYDKVCALAELLQADIHIPDTVSPTIDKDKRQFVADADDGTGSYTSKANRELTALFLNIVSQKLATFNEVTSDGITVGQIVTFTGNIIYDNNPDNDRIPYEILYNLNNGRTIANGIIPHTTPEIAYMPSTEQSNELPVTFMLYQNYPNPFNPITTIRFAAPVPTNYKLTLYNTLGQTVKEYNGFAAPGIIDIQWDASHYASGVYFYRLQAGDFVETKKMLFIK